MWVVTATRCGGNRQDQFPAGNLFVAVSEGLWDNGAACGRRYRLSCLSGNNRPCKGDTIDVRVVDFCPKRPCPSTIVLSSDAFGQISNSPNAKINIEYIQYVSSYFYDLIEWSITVLLFFKKKKKLWSSDNNISKTVFTSSLFLCRIWRRSAGIF